MVLFPTPRTRLYSSVNCFGRCVLPGMMKQKESCRIDVYGPELPGLFVNRPQWSAELFENLEVEVSNSTKPTRNYDLHCCPQPEAPAVIHHQSVHLMLEVVANDLAFADPLQQDCAAVCLIGFTPDVQSFVWKQLPLYR